MVRWSACLFALPAALLLAGCGDATLTPVDPFPTPPEFAPGDPDSRSPYLVRDIRPGPASAFASRDAGQLFTLGDRVLFVADDGTHGLELWESDGGAPGTRIVADACPGACSSWAREFTRLGDEVLYQATDGVHGAELWKTDGTAAGTRMVLDLRPGPDGGAPTRFVRLGGELLIDVVAAGGAHELWTTDGTPTGTRLVRELSPPGARTGGFWLPAPGFAYLVLDDGTTGREIWTTDGSAAGTTLLADICPGPCNGVADFSGAMVDGLLFFAGRNTADAPLELWRSDGTASGTRSLGVPYAGDPAPAALGGIALFRSGPERGTQELWRSDGTPGGTQRLRPIAPVVTFEWRGRILMAAFETVFGEELWATDGSAEGTVMLKDINTGPNPAAIRGFVAHGDLLYFGATSERGPELWQTDGTAAGTRLAAEIRPGTSGGLATDVFHPVSFRDRLYFPATDSQSGVELWAFRP